MPEFSNYVEALDPVVGALDGTEMLAASKDGDAKSLTSQQIADLGGGGGTSIPFGTTTGTNTYASATTPATAAYVNGMLVHIKFKDASTGASTLNLDSVGAKKIMISPTVQAGNGHLTDEQNYILSYDSALDGAAGAFIVVGKLIPDADATTKGIAKLISGDTADAIPVRNDVTLANGVVTIDWAAGDIQNLTITEAKVITVISNPRVGKTIILIIPGTNSLTFSTISAVIDGTYAAGVENRIYIQCLKVSGGAEYRITYDNPLNPYPFAVLTSSSNVSTWTIANQEWFSKRTLTLTENSTFAISGALNGFQGVCRVTASGANRTINIPAGAGHQLSGVGDPTRKDTLIPSGETYVFFFEYDGTTFIWGYTPVN